MLNFLKQKPRRDIEFSYGGTSIILPGEHLLPKYRKIHRLYDAFLGHLVKYIEPKSTVIDVGANCGDTLILMFKENYNLYYICIEPDPIYFAYLSNNAQKISKGYPQGNISLIKSLVGASIDGVELVGNNGTKKAVPSQGAHSIRPQKLDSILFEEKTQKVRLIKSDVDGFDYDVINSAMEVIKNHKPILFFECDCDNEIQLQNYIKTTIDLEKIGYVKWVIFDNFGEVVLKTNNVKDLHQLLAYVNRQNNKRSTRTIWYFDILACVDADRNLIDKVVDDYLLI